MKQILAAFGIFALMTLGSCSHFHSGHGCHGDKCEIKSKKCDQKGKCDGKKCDMKMKKCDCKGKCDGKKCDGKMCAEGQKCDMKKKKKKK